MPLKQLLSSHNSLSMRVHNNYIFCSPWSGAWGVLGWILVGKPAVVVWAWDHHIRDVTLPEPQQEEQHWCPPLQEVHPVSQSLDLQTKKNERALIILSPTLISRTWSNSACIVMKCYTLWIVIVIQEGASVSCSACCWHQVIIIIVIFIFHDGFLHRRPRVTHALVQHPIVILIKKVIIVIPFFSCSGLNITTHEDNTITLTFIHVNEK